MEVTNIFIPNNYSLDDTERICIIKNWLDREGSQFIKSITEA